MERGIKKLLFCVIICFVIWGIYVLQLEMIVLKVTRIRGPTSAQKYILFNLSARADFKKYNIRCHVVLLCVRFVLDASHVSLVLQSVAPRAFTRMVCLGLAPRFWKPHTPHCVKSRPVDLVPTRSVDIDSFLSRKCSPWKGMC